MTLCQLCSSSSLWLIIILLFKFGWLDLLWDPTFNQAGPSLTAQQFIALKSSMLSSPRSTDMDLSLGESWVPYTCLVYFGTLIWTLNGMWNAHKLGKNSQILDFDKLKWFLPCLLFTLLLPDWKDNKGKDNLVPRVSHLTVPWSERRETLVGSGHVSPGIWEMTIKLLKGWAA